MNSVCIIVITWNNSDDSIECIESLCRQKDINLTILSVDNDSSDGSVNALQSFIASTSYNVQFIETGKNGGTAGGFNAGIRWAIDHNYTYVGTLNADAVADERWASSLVSELETHADTGLVTGLLLRRNGKTIDTSGDFYTTWGVPAPRNRDAKREAAPNEPGYVFGTSGGAFLARTLLFKEIGLFDETFFMYYEDVDLSFRAQLAGYKIRYTPKAIAYHKLGASSSTVPGLATYNTFKNLPVLFVKNMPLGLWPEAGPRFFLTYTLILGHALLKRNRTAAIRGVLKSWTLLPHALTERRHIQKQRKVTPQYISSIILHDIPLEQTGMRRFRKFFTGKP